jgi:hypothetical protein
MEIPQEIVNSLKAPEIVAIQVNGDNTITVTLSDSSSYTTTNTIVIPSYVNKSFVVAYYNANLIDTLKSVTTTGTPLLFNWANANPAYLGSEIEFTFNGGAQGSGFEGASTGGNLVLTVLNIAGDTPILTLNNSHYPYDYLYFGKATLSNIGGFCYVTVDINISVTSIGFFETIRSYSVISCSLLTDVSFKIEQLTPNATAASFVFKTSLKITHP